ncbi:MAG TPA: calcium/proton exchanger [Firmicutes bacterium]|nr:calcium/proton exchanger [Bacillota bacterium]
MRQWIWRLSPFVLVPLAWGLARTEASAAWAFAAAALALVTLGVWIHGATERLANRLGPVAGGLLNVVAGNGTELIITLFALAAGMVGVVKATLIGSMLSNVLLVMGLAMFLGGLRHPVQRFDSTLAATNAAELGLAVLALALPSLAARNGWGVDGREPVWLSTGVALVLLAVYVLSTVYTLKQDRRGPAGAGPFQERSREPERAAKESLGREILVLLASAAATVLMSDVLIHTLEPAIHSLHLPRRLVGLVVVPLLGNAVEHATAIIEARANRMTLAYQIAVGSSTQIALFVTPLLVLAGWGVRQEFTLVFHPLELLAAGLAVFIAVLIHLDSRSNWLEGVQLIAAYLIFVLAFYFTG